MQLYKLVSNYLDVWNMVTEPDADLDMLEETLQSIEAAIEVKAENTAAIIKQLNITADMIAEEIKRLQERKRAFENRAERIKEYLLKQLELAGIEKVSTATFTVSIRKNPPSVDVYDVNKIPSGFQIVKYDIDKAAIKKALTSGHDVPGARLVQGKSLQIR